MEERLAHVLALGIADSRAKEIVKKDAAYTSLMEVVKLAGLAAGEARPKSQGALLYALSSTFPKAGSKGSLESVARAVAEGKLDSNDRLAAALQAAEEKGPNATVTAAELAERCRFGVVYTDEQVAAAAAEAVAAAGTEAGWESAGRLLEQVRRALPFGDGGKAKQAVDAALTVAVGAPKPKDKKSEAKKPLAAAAAEGGKKKGKGAAKTAVARLPPIDVSLTSAAIAEQLFQLAAEAGAQNRLHAVEMIADVSARFFPPCVFFFSLPRLWRRCDVTATHRAWRAAEWTAATECACRVFRKNEFSRLVFPRPSPDAARRAPDQCCFCSFCLARKTARLASTASCMRLLSTACRLSLDSCHTLVGRFSAGARTVRTRALRKTRPNLSRAVSCQRAAKSTTQARPRPQPSAKSRPAFFRVFFYFLARAERERARPERDEEEEEGVPVDGLRARKKNMGVKVPDWPPATSP